MHFIQNNRKIYRYYFNFLSIIKWGEIFFKLLSNDPVKNINRKWKIF